MCWRCACVSVTLLAVVDAALALSLPDEQPASSTSTNKDRHAITATCVCVLLCSSSPRKRGPSDFDVEKAKTLDSRFRGNDGFSIFASLLIVVPTQIPAMPPAASERLEQRGGVGVTVGLRRNQRDARLLVILFGSQQREIAGVTVARLLLRELQRGLGRAFGIRRSVQRVGVLLQRVERVGHVLEGGQHRALVLLGRLRIGR